MSLTSGLHCPRTPLRRFLDRELSAGPKPLRESFRAQHTAEHTLLPPPGVGTEAGTVGTAIDYRLRLAFTAAEPVDPVALAGIDLTGTSGRDAGMRMRAVGEELAARLTETVARLDLDNRSLPMERAQDEEEDLASLLLAASWYQINFRAPIGFTYTPLAIAATENPDAFTLDQLLKLPHRDMVTDVVNQLYKAANGPLKALRDRTQPQSCTPGPTFPNTHISADADLVVDGLLLDFKSTRCTRAFRKIDAWQLLGYLLLDTTDLHRIDTLGLYLTRSGVLANWPVEEYLDLLGTRRRDLPALRSVFTELLAGCTADLVPDNDRDEHLVQGLLQRLAPIIAPGHCLVCAQPLPESAHRREYCSRWCSVRSQALRRKGWLPTRPQATTLPRSRKEVLRHVQRPEAVSLRSRCLSKSDGCVSAGQV